MIAENHAGVKCLENDVSADSLTISPSITEHLPNAFRWSPLATCRLILHIYTDQLGEEDCTSASVRSGRAAGLARNFVQASRIYAPRLILAISIVHYYVMKTCAPGRRAAQRAMRRCKGSKVSLSYVSRSTARLLCSALEESAAEGGMIPSILVEFMVNQGREVEDEERGVDSPRIENGCRSVAANQWSKRRIGS